MEVMEQYQQQPIETREQLKAVSQNSLLLVHQITSSDLQLQSTQRKAFSIAWFGRPFLLQGNKNGPQCIMTLKSDPLKTLTIQRLSSEMQRYSDLRDHFSQQKAQSNIQNTPDLTHVPQWFQCTKCGKWRVHVVSKSHFPLLTVPPNWSCSQGSPPQNDCSCPQVNPSPFTYTDIQINALKLQRTLMQQAAKIKPTKLDKSNWKHMAHHILDRIIRKFDCQYGIIHPFIYCTYHENNTPRISIHAIKYQLEQNQIKSLRRFALQLRTMLDQGLTYTSLRSHAMLLYSHCGRIMKELPLPSEITQMFSSPHHHQHNTPVLQIASTEYKSREQMENMPALERPRTVIEIRGDSEEQQVASTHNSDTNTNININTDNTSHTMEDTNRDSTKTSDTETDNTLAHDTLPNEEKREDEDDDIDVAASTDNNKADALPKLSFEIAVKPQSIEAEDTFESVQAFPVILHKIRMIIHQIKAFDKELHFFKHVQKEGYREVVTQPIHFGEILDKMDRNEYDIIADISEDIRRIWSNCYAFNGAPDRNKPELCGFSNYASELEWAMDEYWKELEAMVKRCGYVDDNKTQRICTKLGIGQVSTNRLYYFKTRLEVYQCIERLFETYDTATFTSFLNTKTSNFCREMKNGMNVKGPVIPLYELRRTIVARFKTLKHRLYGTSAVPSPQKARTVSCEPVSSHESSSTSPSLPLRKSLPISRHNCIMDTDSESDAEVRTADIIKPTVPKTLYVIDKDGLRIRDGLECPAPTCHATLQFIPNGIHNHCFAMNNFMRCDGCKLVLSNKTDVAYYHCLDGCLAYGTSEAHQYYLCTACASRYCDSPQKYLSLRSHGLGFNGVWIYLETGNKPSCDIMIMLQDSNRISWKYKRQNVYQDEEVFHGRIEEINDSKRVVLDIDDAKHMEYRSAIWEYENDLEVTFTFNGANKNRIYHKLSPLCKECKCAMQCLYTKMLPNKSNRCDKMECSADFESYDYMEFGTMKAMNYAIFHEDICQNEFYYYCAKCNQYCLCAGCALMQHEAERNRKRKESLNNNAMDIDSWMRDANANEIRDENNNNNNNNNNNKNNSNDAEKLAQFERELSKERQRIHALRDKLNRVELERDYWRNKHETMTKSIQDVYTEFDE